MVHPEELTDTLLLQHIRKDDDTAFNQLYDRYWKLLWKLACQKTGDQGDAKDLVQELFIDIWNRRKTITVTSDLRVYLVSALYLKVFKYFRSRGFREEQYRHFAAYIDQTSQHKEKILLELQETEKELGSLQAIMEATIARMPPQMRKVFTLKYLHQQTTEQIATDLQLSVNTVKNHLKEGRNRLRKAGGEYPTGMVLLLWIIDSSY